MINKLSFPLGNPPDILGEDERNQYLLNFFGNLSLIGEAFSLVNPYRKYRLSGNNLDQRKIFSLWSGFAQSSENDSVLIKLNASSHFTFDKGKYFKEIPFPVYVRYGPVIPNIQLPQYLEAGDIIGELKGNEFTIEFADGNLYHLDPLFFFNFFEEENYLDIPEGISNPFLISTQPPLLNIAYPIEAGGLDSYIKLSGDSRDFIIHNPQINFQSKYFSFLSNSAIELNLIGNQSGILKITDISSPMYKTKNTPAFITKQKSNSWTFIPQNDLKPYHKSYQPKNGKKLPGDSLIYHIEITLEDNSKLETIIKQDIKDVIRQEYLFHSNDFQGGTTNLFVPGRENIEFNNKDSVNFIGSHNGDKLKRRLSIQKSNYSSRGNNWVLNVDKTFIVAEHLRWQYREIVKRGIRDTPESFETVKSFDLNINSGWRNPERNEKVKGVKNSNHQFGRALDLKPAHRGLPNNNSDNIGMQVALFSAGYKFLEQLILLNGAENCVKVEILLERGSKLLWSYKVSSQMGDIVSAKGGKYKSVVGSEPPSDEKEAIKLAAKFATHVHIGWKSKKGHSNPLILPELPPEEILRDSLVPPIKYINLILAGTDHENVSAEKQLPLNHIVSSLKNYLETEFPNIETRVVEVSNPIQYLEEINALWEPDFKIKQFFSFSHAWSNGLTLKTPDPVNNDVTEKDQFILDLLNTAYGYGEYEENNPPESIEDIFEFPPNKDEDDDYVYVKSNQFRISNLINLPDTFIRRIRMTFEDAEGVYLVGCNTNQIEHLNQPGQSTFSKIFASIIQQPVYGALYSSYVFAVDKQKVDKPLPQGNTYSYLWKMVDLSRQDPPTKVLEKLVVLVPGKTIANNLRDLWADGFFNIPNIPRTSNLIEVYRTILTKVYPFEGAKDVKMIRNRLRKKAIEQLVP